MKYRPNPVYAHIARILCKAADEVFSESSLSPDDLLPYLGEAPNYSLGHVAFSCFPLAKKFRKSPTQIAEALAQKVVSDRVLARAQATGPYLNFFICANGVGKLVIGPINRGEYLAETLLETDSGERWMIEYSQPNTHKTLHVGHMRNLCLGNALVRMARYAGHEVLAATYPGDVGTHVAKCLWYLEHSGEEAPSPEHRGAWLGEVYVRANQRLEKERGTDKEEQNRAALTEILRELHAQSGPHFEQWRRTRQWSIQLMQELYAWADVSFDHWFWESEMDAPSVQWMHELHEKDVLAKDQGAIGMDLSADKLGFCLLVKSDGTGLYATKDLQLAKIKFEKFGVDRNIYIVDNRQSHHFRQVFKVLEKIGFEQAGRCEHLPYEVVELSTGAMGSREGNIVPVMKLITRMEETIKARYLQKYLDDSASGWSKEDVEETARMIAGGAIKYGMIRVDNQRKIVFDMEEWVRLDGESGPYLQYVCARISSLYRTIGETGEASADWGILKTDSEIALLLKIVRFREVLAGGVQHLQTMHLCAYLYELGKLFNAFYANCPIAKAEDDALKNARLSLARATGAVMRQGLAILGIPAPERM